MFKQCVCAGCFHIIVVCVCVCIEILEGGVEIIQNEFLSYAPQINWLDIVKDNKADIIIHDNGPERKRHLKQYTPQ